MNEAHFTWPLIRLLSWMWVQKGVLYVLLINPRIQMGSSSCLEQRHITFWFCCTHCATDTWKYTCPVALHTFWVVLLQPFSNLASSSSAGVLVSSPNEDSQWPCCVGILGTVIQHTQQGAGSVEQNRISMWFSKYPSIRSWSLGVSEKATQMIHTSFICSFFSRAL